MLLFFDTETTGFLAGKDLTNPRQPHVVQLAAVLTDVTGKVKHAVNLMVKPDGYDIPVNASNVHGITTEEATKFGIPAYHALSIFRNLVDHADLLVCHNVGYDMPVIGANMHRHRFTEIEKPTFCTMSNEKVVHWCALPPTAKMRAAGRIHFKNPNLGELHEKCFGKGFGNAHNAMADVKATMMCFFHMLKEGVIEI